MTLSEFLLARIAEDEREVDHPLFEGSRVRVLAECEAKRRIVTTVDLRHVGGDDGYGIAFEDVCKELAAVYSNHPDYNEEWKP